MSDIVRIVFIAGITLSLLIFSWFFSIKEKRYHGIARFFSFECIFILILLNIERWFVSPFILRQVISWILLIFSLYLAVAGFFLLHVKGKSENGIENTQELVKTGIYRYVRHPLYLSLLLLGFGIMLKDPGSIQIILGIINLCAVYFTALLEEKEMDAKFGINYNRYREKTWMFIPFII
jgi:protein-S-isoprenylcysteine O-methyltransferase Ste14